MRENHRFLHGTIEITIFHATTDPQPFLLKCIGGKGNPTSVIVKIDDEKVASTSYERDRIWNQTFQILCAHPSDSIVSITMKTKCHLLGKITIHAHQMLNKASLINGYFPLNTENEIPIPKLKLRFMVWFKPAELELTWERLITNGGSEGLKNASFSQHSNCVVRLYQDAHHHTAFKPHSEQLPRKLWEDVYKAIEDAKILIYIAGWSFNPTMVLVRDSDTSIPHAIGVQLGKLLKRKAEEGVAVRIMLWDDETSLPIIKNKGVMKTHDEDAFAYFKDTKVVCRLCPRLHHELPMLFAHHQKTISLDTRIHLSSSNREIMSFVGGLDLCDGRYDTEEHSLFRTLNNDTHCSDFYQSSLPGASFDKGGPREPWHDTHACIIGEAGKDVLRNFEQRWTKQCNPALLVPLSTIPDLCEKTTMTRICNDRDWKVQVFRSIDNLSVALMKENFKVERSIHEAYIEAIRRAERFIYIENQYFIGGCQLWARDQHCGCKNLIPIEIALKVASKIRANQRFAVYVVIPMWPEGDPESETVNDILHWTRETMGMMYKLIGQAIKESGNHGHPKDYLNFFCLANREEVTGGEYIPPYSPRSNTQYEKAQKNRRFMIYVHSKVMIVDDVYILIGSANVNQRSMDGKRDTEIAIGCYQIAEEKIAHGDIHMYRMSLWYEHTGGYDELFSEPHTVNCVSKIRSIGDHMWEIYSGKEIIDMDGAHIVTYPICVTTDGSIKDLEGAMCYFPDTKSLITGRRSRILPPTATT